MKSYDFHFMKSGCNFFKDYSAKILGGFSLIEFFCYVLVSLLRK